MFGKLDDHRLRYLEEAIRLGSVRLAADALGVNPSVVSRQIVLLEKELGMPLIERHARGVRATEAGEFLAGHFRQWKAEREDAVARLREMRGLGRGHVSLIIGGGFVTDLMSGPLPRFWDLYPRITLTIEIGAADEIAQSVADDRFHLGFGYNVQPHPRVRFVEAASRPVMLICRPDHELALRGRPVTLAELAPFPLALLQPGSGVRRQIGLAEQEEGVSLAPILSTSSMEMLRQFVRDGRGLTLLPAFAINTEVAAGTLVPVAIASPALAAAKSHIVTRLGRALPAAALELLRFLVREMRAFRK